MSKSTPETALDLNDDDVYACDNCEKAYKIGTGKTRRDMKAQGDNYCCATCMDEDCEDEWERSCTDPDLIDGVGFAMPGSNSALRAATENNPRNLPCPNCRAPNRLTPIDKARGYQCDSCADRAERGGDC